MRTFTDLEELLLEFVEEAAKVTDDMKHCLDTCVQRNGNDLKTKIENLHVMANHCFKERGVR
jgi:hypothetical protein